MSLRDALLKAGKVSKKDAQNASTERRKNRRQTTGKGHDLEAAKAAKQLARHEARVAKQKEAELLRVAETKAKAELHERLVRAKNLIAQWQWRIGRGRKMPWYFVGKDGTIGRLMVDEKTASGLEHGALSIVEHPLNDSTPIVRQAGVARLVESAPGCVRFYLGVDGPDDPLVAPPRYPTTTEFP